MMQVPIVLVHTWISLASDSNKETDDVVKIRAISMLQNLVGTSHEKKAIEVWIVLARNDESSKVVREEALQRLTNTIGSVEKIATYMKENNIQ